MKKYIAIFLCVCSLCALAMTASASDGEPDYIAEYEAQYGKMPAADDYSSDEEYQAAYDIWFAGYVPYANMRFAEWSRQQAAAEEAAQIAAEKEAAEKAAAEQPSAATSETVESGGLNYENHSSVPVSTGSDDKYPVGSYVDPAGNVFAPDGTLLSPGTTPAYAPADWLDEDAAFLPDELANPDNFPADGNPDTPAVIPDIAVDPPTWYIDDLRPTDLSVEVLTGLKALVTSIFGEYTPVTTTSVISETVGNDTYQYLVETVAPGAAGIDYEWVAGVLLFAIMLYCLMKLLGGVLK